MAVGFMLVGLLVLVDCDPASDETDAGSTGAGGGSGKVLLLVSHAGAPVVLARGGGVRT